MVFYLVKLWNQAKSEKSNGNQSNKIVTSECSAILLKNMENKFYSAPKLFSDLHINKKHSRSLIIVEYFRKKKIVVKMWKLDERRCCGYFKQVFILRSGLRQSRWSSSPSSRVLCYKGLRIFTGRISVDTETPKLIVTKIRSFLFLAPIWAC